MAQSTWAADTNTWAADTNTWAVSTYSATATLGANSSVSSSQTAAFPVTANMTQLNLTELNEEDAIKLASATLGASVGTTASASVSFPVSITLSDTQTIKNNVNFEESITLSVTGNLTSVNNFLWNDVTEDTSTTWTKVADPDE
jgi:hypothetical protein